MAMAEKEDRKKKIKPLLKGHEDQRAVREEDGETDLQETLSPLQKSPEEISKEAEKKRKKED